MEKRELTSVDLSKAYPSKEEESPHYDKKAKDFTVDYLTGVREWVMKQLNDSYGKSVMKSFEIRWVMTVPAVWSLEGKNTTMECAEAAGLGDRKNLLMISEPECAASYALKRLQPSHLKIGSHIIVCDCGGGTVDLISYRIRRLEPLLQVEESGVCNGGKCGGVFINRIFEEEVDKKLQKAGKTISNYARGQLRQQFEVFVRRSPTLPTTQSNANHSAQDKTGI